MALRDQPYLPLYVQDFLTDEKLAECSASANGVYIRVMCIMHKSEEYGKIYIKEKDLCRSICPGKTSGKYDGKLSAIAAKLARHLPYSTPEIEAGLEELLDEGVLSLEGNCLYQKRMVRDAEISTKRAISGRRGAQSTNNKYDLTPKKEVEIAETFASAKSPANSENEYEYENEYKNDKKGGKSMREEEVAKVVVVEDPEFEDFVEWIAAEAPRVAKMKEPFTASQYYKIKAEYNLEDVRRILQQMHNYKALKTVSAYLTCLNWLRRDKVPTLADPAINAEAVQSHKLAGTLEAISGALIK